MKQDPLRPESREAADEVEAARACVYRFLALACTDPRASRWPRILDPVFLRIASASAQLLAQHPSGEARELAPGEALQRHLDLRPIAGMLGADRGSFVARHDAVFGLVVSKECPPYETEYCPQTFSVYRSEQLADIAGFYHAFGVTTGRDAPERPDHAALELEFMSWLVDKTRHARRGGEKGHADAETCLGAQVGFLAEHLAWWIPAFARALARKAEGPAEGDPWEREPVTFHGHLARALASFVGIERALLGVEPPRTLVAPRPTFDAHASSCASCSS